MEAVRWDDGLLSWQLTRDGELVGHWIGVSYQLGRECVSSLGRYDRTGDFALCEPTPEHLRILEDHFAPHRGTGSTLLVDGDRYEGDYTGERMRPVLRREVL